MNIRSYNEPRPRSEPHDACLWAVTGDDPAAVSAAQVAIKANRCNRQPHLVWNPLDDHAIEMIPPEEDCWYSDVRMYTVLVVASDRVPFTEYGPVTVMNQIPESIPDGWPCGPPTGEGHPWHGTQGPGHYTADQVPLGRPRPFVGTVDISKIRRQQ